MIDVSTILTLADIAPLETGIGSVLYGALRPVAFFSIVLAVYYSPEIELIPERLMAIGAFLSGINSVIFLFVNADIEIPIWLTSYVELSATPSFVLFAIGFLTLCIRNLGLEFGKDASHDHTHKRWNRK